MKNVIHISKPAVPCLNPRTIMRPLQSTAPLSATPPHFTYRGGPLLSSVEVYTIFWGASWSQTYSDLMNQINAFYDYVVDSPLIDQLNEYSVPNYPINKGKHNDSYIISTPAPMKFTFDFQIRNLLKSQVAQGLIPSPTANSLYVVYTAPGIAVINGFAISCISFCGYHSSIDNNLFYAVINYPNCKPCIGPMSGPLEALTVVSSHELCEAITDPIPGHSWYDNQYGEIADVCEWKTKQLGDFSVQLEWSNAAGNCI